MRNPEASYGKHSGFMTVEGISSNGVGMAVLG